MTFFPPPSLNRFLSSLQIRGPYAQHSSYSGARRIKVCGCYLHVPLSLVFQFVFAIPCVFFFCLEILIIGFVTSTFGLIFFIEIPFVLPPPPSPPDSMRPTRCTITSTPGYCVALATMWGGRGDIRQFIITIKCKNLYLCLMYTRI